MPSGADLRRLAAGTHPVLLDHVARYLGQIGRVVSAKATNEGVEGEIEVFGYADDCAAELVAVREQVHQMLDDSGGGANVSIGTRLYESEWVETEIGDIIRSVRWEPDEVSLVAIGASRTARLQEVK